MRKLLLVDDSGIARKFIKRKLENEAFSIFEASNGKEALGILEKERPDAVLLDLLMPEMDGFAFLRALKEQGISLPVIVVSADVQKEVRKEVLELGATRMLNKPLEDEELFKTLKEVLDDADG